LPAKLTENRVILKEADYNKGFTISSPAKNIYLNPDKALEKENSYIGLAWGMKKGMQ